MTKLKYIENHCNTCVFAMPQEDSSMGLVDCPKKGYGNAYSSDTHPCEKYWPNQRLVSLRESAIKAVREFEKINAIRDIHPKRYSNEIYQKDLHKAAVKSNTMQCAYALVFGLGYDDAAAILHKEAHKPPVNNDGNE